MENETSYRRLAWVAATALFMQALDATILNTALPAIARSLNESPLEMQLSIISYTLTVALLIPLSGWVADKFGTLNIFRISVLVFVLGSVACAFSHSLMMLVFSRIVQGIGGAMMMPVARLAIIRTVPKNQLISVWNLMAMTGLIGPILGPMLGGWLVTYASWHWIFLINIPIGIVGIIVAGKFMPNVKGKIARFDWLGFLLFGISLVGLTLGLELIGDSQSNKILAMSILLLSVILLFVYGFYASKTQNPLLPLSLFHNRPFRIGIIANLLIRLCSSGVPFLLPLMLQVVFHYPADVAGLMMMPIAMASILTKTYVKTLLRKLGYKTTLILTSASMTCAVIALGTLDINSPIWLHLLLVVWYGSNMSIMFTSVNTLAISELQDENASTGSTLLSIAQQVGLGFGIAVAAIVLNLYRILFGENPTQLQEAFNYSFFTLAMVGILLIWLLTNLRNGDGDHLYHH